MEAECINSFVTNIFLKSSTAHYNLDIFLEHASVLNDMAGYLHRFRSAIIAHTKIRVSIPNNDIMPIYDIIFSTWRPI